MNRRMIAGLALVALAAVLAVLAVEGVRVATPAPLASAASTTPPGAEDDGTPTVAADESPTADPLTSQIDVEPGPQALPVRLEVPAIGVDTELEQLGLLDDGSLATPVDTDLAGWFKGGPRPGAVGPAVIAGHVSWNGDPSVFYRLTELAEGDSITVEQDDGAIVTYEVTRMEQHPKDEFPTVDVYANTEGPELRLITCGGEFDSSTGHFDDNIVVFARAVGA
ncbi:class F sortase [Demequina sp. NBRC 110053]|uniref:class F sortase n=1 Tax=Demequina sp. NBRC 110053 TaxID=1570342 RepID=UPI000A0761AF|nr:class F sortase [Demequina sp. NBRC 110053]